MICYTGVRIEPASKYPQFNGVPTLVDIALGLGRIPRFGGHTRRWWSGLHHAFVCLTIALDMGMNHRVQLLALLHDAHETVTGDIPAFFKPKEMSAWQEEIDERLFRSLDLWPLSEAERIAIKTIDNRALRAEAWIVGPPNIMSHMDDPLSEDVNIVLDVCREFPTPNDTDGIDSPAARRLYQEYSCLIGDAVHNRRDDTPQGGRTS